MSINEQFVSAREAGILLGITSARIGFLCRQGRFVGATKIGSEWIIPREAVKNHKRLTRGVKPRGYNEKKELKKALAEATNLNEVNKNDH